MPAAHLAFLAQVSGAQCLSPVPVLSNPGIHALEWLQEGLRGFTHLRPSTQVLGEAPSPAAAGLQSLGRGEEVGGGSYG